MKRVAVFGICGKMGKAISGELVKERDIDLIGGLDREDVNRDIGEVLGVCNTGFKVHGSYNEIKELNPDVIVDFTNADVAVGTINWAIDNNIDIIVGTTGIKKSDLEAIEKKATGSKSNKVLIAPNFSIGAIIMVEVSKMVAKYFDNCEIIEMHHDKKKDAPSGTSMLTSEQVSRAKHFNKNKLKAGESEVLQGSRGAFTNGVHIHSVRLPGLLAHQNVIFGAMGQTLSIRHDSIDRLAFYPGVILAIRSMDSLGNYTYGLDKLISL